MKKYRLDKTITKEKFRFYLESSTHFRFPFFDPENPYRKNGLFIQVEETLMEVGERFRMDYGENFISINLRGSWLRGIPLEDDDLDIMFIVRGIDEEEQNKILEYTRDTLRERNGIDRVCEKKEEGGIQLDPISFLDIDKAGTILNAFMYGLGHFLEKRAAKGRDDFQDDFFGSTIKKKLLRFLKGGILIPYVGWIYGKGRKKEVFDELGKSLPIPTHKAGVFSEDDIDATKEVIRQTFIARNLIFPSVKLRKFTMLSDEDISEFKAEALELYRSLEPLESIHARAVLNYLYTAKIELEFFGKRIIKDRVDRFTGTYDKLVDYILHVKF